MPGHPAPTPTGALVMLGFVLVFLLAVVAFIAFRHHQSGLFFLAFALTGNALMLGKLLPARQR
ncbi:MAG: hypothetical protein NVS3B26_22490 [Mycobacteriales bacterium]